jgi:hypothetical protein
MIGATVGIPELPIEQPTKFEFVINLESSQADRRDDLAECAGESG